MKKTAHQPQPHSNIENLMQMMQQMMGMFMGGLAGSMALTRSPDKITLGPPLANQDLPSNPSPSTGLKHAADSKPFPQNVDIEVWLSQLDMDPICGNRNINYSQFSSSLSSTGIYELSDLAVLETCAFEAC